MAKIRNDSTFNIHSSLSHTVEHYLERSSVGDYGLLHGMYHLAVVGDGEHIWRQSRLEDWYYEQYKHTKSAAHVFHIHQLALSHFVTQQGRSSKDDARLCALILQSEKLQNSSEQWLQWALEDYQRGTISVETMFQMMAYLSKDSWFECVELLIGIEVDKQLNTETGRLSNIRKILELLQKERQTDVCDDYIPFERIGWYAERICEWSPEVSIEDLLTQTQIDRLAKSPEHFAWLREHGAITEVQYFQYLLYNDKIEQILELFHTLSTDVIFEVLSSLRNTHINRNLTQWMVLSVALEYLEEHDIDTPENIWDAWKGAVHRLAVFLSPDSIDLEYRSEFNEPMEVEDLRFNDEMEEHEIRWRQQQLFEQSQSLFAQISQEDKRKVVQRLLSYNQEQIELQTLIAVITNDRTSASEVSVHSFHSLLNGLRESDDLESALSDWLQFVRIHGVKKDSYSKMVEVLQTRLLSRIQQDRVFSVLYPLIKDEMPPNEHIFAYLYVRTENHSSDLVVQLQSYFERFLTLDWVAEREQEEFMTGRKIVEILKHLLGCLSEHQRYAQCCDIFKYIQRIVAHDSMEILRTNLTNELILVPLLWHDLKWTCQLIEESKIPYGKPGDFWSPYINKVIEHVMRHRHLWSQMHIILQWKFFFKHPMTRTVGMIEDEAVLLSTLSQEHILHMMPQFSVHLLDLLLSVSLVDRFPIMSQRTKSILHMVSKRRLVHQNGSLENEQIATKVEQLLAEAKQMNDDLMRDVSIYSAIRFARFFEVSLQNDVELPEEKRKTDEADASTNPAVVPLYRTSEINDSMIHALIDTSQSEFSSFMHCKRMVEVLENDRQPALLRERIQRHLLEETVVELATQFREGEPEQMFVLLRAYNLLLEGFARLGLESEKEQVQQTWMAQCDSMDVQVLLTCYAVAHSRPAYPSMLLSSSQMEQLKSTIMESNWHVSATVLEHFSTDDAQVSDLSIWQYLLVLYQNDDVAFYACLRRLISVMRRLNVDWSEVIPHVPRISDIFMTQSDQWLQSGRVHPLVTFLRHMPERKEVFISWLDANEVSAQLLLQVYVRLLDSELHDSSLFNQVYDSICPNSEHRTLIARTMHLLNEELLGNETAQQIARRTVFEPEDWMASYQEYVDVFGQDAELDIFEHSMHQRHLVMYIFQGLNRGWLDSTSANRRLKEGLKGYSIEKLRHLSLLEPAKFTLHRGIVLSILIHYAKQNEQQIVDQIVETCPELVSA